MSKNSHCHVNCSGGTAYSSNDRDFPPQPRVALVAITKHGAMQARELAIRIADSTVVVAGKFQAIMDGLPGHRINAYQGGLREQMAGLFSHYHQIVFFLSLGAVVRLIAPHLTSKYEDPGILVVDDAGQFVIPVLSGHVGGANTYAQQVAELLGATAVITTASDVGKTLSVDILGRDLGWKIEASKTNITRAAAHVVNREPVALVQEAGNRQWWHHPTPLPANIHLFDRMEDLDPERFDAILWISHRNIYELEMGNSLRRRLLARLVIYRP